MRNERGDKRRLPGQKGTYVNVYPSARRKKECMMMEEVAKEMKWTVALVRRGAQALKKKNFTHHTSTGKSPPTSAFKRSANLCGGGVRRKGEKMERCRKRGWR